MTNFELGQFTNSVRETPHPTSKFTIILFDVTLISAAINNHISKQYKT